MHLLNSAYPCENALFEIETFHHQVYLVYPVCSFIFDSFHFCPISSKRRICSGMTHEYSNLQDQHDHMTITWNLCIIYFKISVRNKRNIVENMYSNFISHLSGFPYDMTEKGCPILKASVKLLIILILKKWVERIFYLWKHKTNNKSKIINMVLDRFCMNS